MTEQRYKVTVTYDELPDEPNVFHYYESPLKDYLTHVGVPFDPDHLADGGVKRLEPEPNGVVLRWETAPPEEPGTTHGRTVEEQVLADDEAAPGGES